VSGVAKLNNNQILERGELSFYWVHRRRRGRSRRCRGSRVVVVESQPRSETSCCRAPERCWDRRVADVDEIAGLEGDFPHFGAS
jgi:hypothetical protein